MLNLYDDIRRNITKHDPALKIEAAIEGFFAVKMKRVQIEHVPETGRTYFLLDGKIIAVAKRLLPGDQKR